MLVFYLYFGILALKRQPGNNNVTSVLAYLTFKCAFFVYIVVFALPFLEVLFVLFFYSIAALFFQLLTGLAQGLQLDISQDG